MAKGAPEAPQGGGENALDFLWVVVLVLTAVVFIWYFGKIYIAEGIFWIRWVEIKTIQLVLGYSNRFLQVFNLPLFNLQIFSELGDFIARSYGTEVKFQDLVNISSVVGRYLRYPVVLLLLFLSAKLYFGSSAQRFRTIFNMKRLREVEWRNWPHITPIVNLDLVVQPLDKTPWAIALNPMKFCKQYHLLTETVKNGKPAVDLKRGAANRVLSLQLGARWYGHDALPEHLRALFAVFAARIDGNKAEGDRLLEQISRSAGTGVTKFNFHGTSELLRKHGMAKQVQKITHSHGYVTGVLASMLSAAREVGVLATAEFLWLKIADRRMWYMLNSVGRYTAVAEISGAYAHWLAERKLGLPLMVPMVDEAVRGLDAAINEMVYVPDEE